MRQVGVSLNLCQLAAGVALAFSAAARFACASPEPTRGPLRMGAIWTAPVDDDNWRAEKPVNSPAAPGPPDKDVETSASDFPSGPDPHAKRWHLDAAWRGSYTKLRATKQQLDRRLDLPLQFDFLHLFDEPYTPLDRRSDLGLTTWYLGVGRQEGPRWIWTWYAGGGAGQDLNHQKVLNASFEVDFRYAYYYTGLLAEFYPWKVPSAGARTAWHERLAFSRPFLLTGLETGYVSAEGEGDYKLGGMLMYHDEQKIRDWLLSVSIGAGWSFPLSEHWSINLMGNYAFHFYRPAEYNGWNWTTVIRYTF
jgi:hypothetical protein